MMTNEDTVRLMLLEARIGALDDLARPRPPTHRIGFSASRAATQ
jgi:hypothetical protein